MNESNDDRRLSNLLRESPGRAPLPPRFQERVWQRIESAERIAAPAFSLSEWLTALFAKPAFAPVCLAALLLIGAGTGYFWAGHDAARWESQLSSHYAASLTPYAAGRP